MAEIYLTLSSSCLDGLRQPGRGESTICQTVLLFQFRIGFGLEML